MKQEPRQSGDYSKRQVEAAHRVLVDVGQVLASFVDCIVVIGGSQVSNLSVRNNWWNFFPSRIANSGHYTRDAHSNSSASF